MDTSDPCDPCHFSHRLVLAILLECFVKKDRCCQFVIHVPNIGLHLVVDTGSCLVTSHHKNAAKIWLTISSSWAHRKHINNLITPAKCSHFKTKAAFWRNTEAAMKPAIPLPIMPIFKGCNDICIKLNISIYHNFV